MRKLGQMEMVGLVVIVILITLGMLFLAIFALKTDDTKKIFTRKELAYSTMTAVLKTTVDCEERSGRLSYPQLGKELMEDAAANYNEYSGDLCHYKCDNKHCVVFLNETVYNLLKDSLGQWNKKYEFHSNLIEPNRDVKPLVRINPDICKHKERDSSGLFPISTPSGLVENELWVCD